MSELPAADLGPAGPPAALGRAREALRAGRVVAFPTDTVYGLAVDPTVPGAMAALFETKGRPATVAVAVLVADLAQAEALAADGVHPGLSAPARRLAGRFWPGALTLVVPRRPGLDWDLGGDGGTIGLRCPAAPAARQLCAEVGPLATTSANRHGEPPLHSARDVEAAFGSGLVVVDGGRCDALPSTVVGLTGGPVRCLRRGELPFEDVVAVVSGG